VTTTTLTRILGLLLATLLLAGCIGPFAGPEPKTFDAIFTRSQNLFEGSEIKMLGINIGNVRSLEPEGPYVRAILEIDPDVKLPADAVAEIKPLSFLGERFVQIGPTYTGGPELEEGATIPVERTRVPSEVDEFLASFEEFLDSIEPDTLADLVDVLADTLAGQGDGLNELIDNGSTTIRILNDASDDLVGVADELGQLNETVATRAEQLRTSIRNWEVLFATIADESDIIIEGVGHLQRLTAELRVILDEHADEIVSDLEVLTTTLSTVERNLDRIHVATRGSRKLFEAAERGIDFKNARITLMNRFTQLTPKVTERLALRLAGTCRRLAYDECGDVEFWEPILPVMTCVEGFVPCEGDKTGLAEALRVAIGAMPDGMLDDMEAEAAERAEAEERERREREEREREREQEEPPPAPERDRDRDRDGLDVEVPTVPGAEQPADGSGIRDRLGRIFGGGR
jgi:phospholipid/cholesterol/gamma-HCH transport system substrate-binding protein